MNARTFDPAFLDFLDEGFAANEEVDDADFTLCEMCPICGNHDLVFDPQREILVDLNGDPHECPEV